MADTPLNFPFTAGWVQRASIPKLITRDDNKTESILFIKFMYLFLPVLGLRANGNLRYASGNSNPGSVIT